MTALAWRLGERGASYPAVFWQKRAVHPLLGMCGLSSSFVVVIAPLVTGAGFWVSNTSFFLFRGFVFFFFFFSFQRTECGASGGRDEWVSHMKTCGFLFELGWRFFFCVSCWRRCWCRYRHGWC